jgi:acyl-CoA synthetase (AMP-forming)/AMP-acid ligase II
VPSSDLTTTATTIVEVLRTRAASTPEKLAFCWLIDGEQEGPRLSYADLDRQARAAAAALSGRAGPGDRALLLYAPGLEFIPAFFGCLYTGVVPVPAYPPRLDRLAQSWQVLHGIAVDCWPAVVLTSQKVAALFGGGGATPHLGDLPWICTDALGPESYPALADLPGAHGPCPPDALAFLQYTSGSTAAPKGVRVTHRNLMHNQRAMQTALGPDGPGVGVSWLPLYHDMGLVGGVLQPVFHGTPCVLMSPLGLLQKPVRWLRALSRYRARSTGAPNFAYELCAERVTAEQKADLDLSGWAVAAVGGEPINPGTLQRFAAAFGPCGFRPEAFVPCYGLAEATLGMTASLRKAPRVRTVSAAALGRGEVADAPVGAEARSFVGCGKGWLEQRVEIVHPEEHVRQEPGRVGEVWVAGPSVADGYWGKPDETERTFRAFLRDTGEGPFLRTGDLGFVEAGELYITGRIKELIVIHGRNHYPADIERTVQGADPALRPGCGAAFETCKDGRPVLVVVQEVERRARGLDVARLLGDVRQAVAERHDLHVHDLQLLEPGSLPKTTSGKVQRQACRLGYEQGTLRTWKGARP